MILVLVVKTKEELKKAQKDKTKEFMIVGELAEKVQKAKGISKLTKKKVIVLSGIIAAGAATAIPTGGASLGASALGAAAVGAGAGAGLSAGAIIAIVSIGGALAAYALYKDYNVDFEATPTGGVKVKCTKRSNKE